ncbi:hypothetical protein QUB00_30125 [Microcoleus sp. F8_C2]
MINPEYDPMLSTIIVGITKLFKEAETNNLSVNQFAAKVWLGTILGVVPEKTLASILFEKATSVSPEESYKMIDKLALDSVLGKKEAIERALSLIMEGLEILNRESIMRNICDKN